MVNPPWRLDPLQTILKIHFPDKGKKDEGDGSPLPDFPNPGSCPCCRISGCGPGVCATCYCPGIFCIPAGGCCVPNGCTFVGMDIVPDSSTACASHLFVIEQWFNCCDGGCGCQDAPPHDFGPNFYPPGSEPTPPP